MNNLVILGAGGLAQEIVWLVEEINSVSMTWNILGYLDSHIAVQNKSFLGYPVLGGFDLVEQYRTSHFIIAFGDARYREKVIDTLPISDIQWATLISPTVRLHPSNQIGKGVVIGRYADITVSSILDDFTMLNIHAVVGHDVRIGKYSIVSPNCTINGGARIGKCCSIGANAFIRDIEIGDYVVVGASSCVVKSVSSNTVIAGVPAKVIKFGEPKHSVTKGLRV